MLVRLSWSSPSGDVTGQPKASASPTVEVTDPHVLIHGAAGDTPDYLGLWCGHPVGASIESTCGRGDLLTGEAPEGQVEVATGYD